jgi:chromosome segregation ATPase
MIQILLVIVCFSLCNEFLLNNGAVSSGSNMSDKHYVYVMDQLAQDRQIRKTMQGFIVQLQQEMKSTKQELMNLKQGNGYLQNLEISQLKTMTMSLKQAVAKLQNGHDSLKQELDQVKSDNKVLTTTNKQLYTRLQNEISACNNKTLKISKDLDKFTHFSADQLKNVTELKTNVSCLNQKIDTMNL